MPVPISSALRARLLGGESRLARLLTITRSDGFEHRWTDADAAVFFDAQTYLAGVGFNISNTSARSDLSVSGGDFDALLGDEGLTRGAVEAGILDGARFRHELICWAAPGDGSLSLGAGFVGEATFEQDGEMRVELRGLAQGLAEQTIRLITPSCPAVFGSQPGEGRVICGVDPTAFTTAVTVTAVSPWVLDLSGFDPTEAGQVDRYVGGLLTFQSGDLQGVAIGLRRSIGAQVELLRPLRTLPALGDTALLREGCPKSIIACRDRFDNAARFKGFPFVAGRDYLQRVGTQ